ncbi:uncharacterized protein LOC106082201 [Stomoxys calcitrans]|uniref:uncharacterized protein LOC106082201 n=1 Tax=Stomoxys calcitrans TaxID=35570 RepID=UPI0027E34153|nr:uncharacterized protein LOC106082201 [Stomoxys calcitrans]
MNWYIKALTFTILIASLSQNGAMVVIKTHLAIIGALNFLNITNGASWTFDLESIKIHNKTPDVIFVSIERKMLSRGNYTTCGIIELKEDLTDELQIEGRLYYSPNGLRGSYIKTPFHAPKSPFSVILQQVYIPVIMETMHECAQNFPYFEKVELPITKRIMTWDECMLSSDNMMSHMKSGFYRAIIKFSNQADITTELDLVIQQT